MSSNRPYLVATALHAVRTGTRLCRSVQATLTAGDAIYKKDKSPVTVADLATQAIVAHRLAEALPGIPLVGEEDSSVFDGEDGQALTKAVLERVRSAWPQADPSALHAAIDLGRGTGGATGRFFTLDPIDGTKGFLRGEQYAIALALVEEGVVTLGVLGCPNLTAPGWVGGSVLVGVRGAGTRLLATDGDDLAGTAVHVSREPDPARLRLCESADPGHSDQSVSRAILARLGASAPPVRMDGQTKYAALAWGSVELYLYTPTEPGRREWIWDHAAGAICVEEAGGRVTDLDGKPLDFSRGRRLTGNRGILASNARLHDAVLEALVAT